jgi:Ca2+-binding EF-hand superfamily protein
MEKNKTTMEKRKGKGKKFKRSKNKSLKTEEEIRVDMITALIVKVKLSDLEINEKYEEFMETYPKGKISKEEFICKANKIVGEKGCFPPESLFRVFDEDHNGSMDFSEYMLATNCANLTSKEDKLAWIFNVFDEDAGGFIDAEEVEKIVVSLFKMAGTELEQEVVYACVKNIQEAVDVDGDGEISKEEFVENAMKIGFIHNILTNNIGEELGEEQLET